MMKKYLIQNILVAVIIFNLISVTSGKDKDSLEFPALEPEILHPRIEQAIKFTLNRYHYKNIPIDDSLSVDIFNRYIQRLDYNRSYFLKSDIESFDKYKYTLDDALGAGNLDFPYVVYTVFQKRFEERQEYISKLLNQDFDFKKDEYYRPDRSEEPWAETPAQLDSIWRKRIKDEALRLKLTGKEWDKIIETLKKRYDTFTSNMRKSQSEDVFQFYMNAFAESFDPHTNYMSPKLSDDFRIRMSQALEGIGASLQTENEYTKVVEIIPGGPADKSHLLYADDRIVGVGQGKDGELVDVIGWRIDDVVQLIRGPKETVVRLQILPKDAALDDPPKIIQIVRDKVKLSDQVAKSDIIDVEEHGRKFKIGVIDLPSFYFDYDGMRRGDPNFASTSNDVKRILQSFDSSKVDGVVIDLRGNGGGFLNEAIELTGLFIKDGPVVQVRNSNGSVKVERDMDSSIYYDGPLAVLVDGFSASASEIFAAAIQDYGRGVVLGTQTYGKGTVQNIIQLDRMFPRSKEKFGQVKLTVAKFYRINGGSTQNAGVLPDIVFPSRWKHSEIGESSQKNALLWDEINPVQYNFYNPTLTETVSKLEPMHQARVTHDQKFVNMLEDIQEFQKRQDEKLISLNEKKRQEIRDKAKAKRDARNDEEEDDEEAENPAHGGKDDLFLVESAKIIGDWVALNNKN